MISKIGVKSLLLALGVFAAPLATASSTNDAMARLEAIMADDARRQASYEAGHERIKFCGYCHGEDGNSKRDYIPNLAGQHPLYLFEQFEQFRDGTREDYVMTKLAQSLSLEERIHIAVYYSQQTAKARKVEAPALASAGEKLFAQRCSSCHGESGQGFQNMPRLAGQPTEYMETALKRFKKMNPAAGSSPMTAIASGLSEQDIKALAAYMTGQ